MIVTCPECGCPDGAWPHAEGCSHGETFERIEDRRHTCTPGLIGSAYGCPACGLGQSDQPTERTE